MKVLIVTPNFPYPALGACEQDRARGIEWFVKHRHEVYVIAKTTSKHPPELIKEVAERLGIKIVGVPYKYNGPLGFFAVFKKFFLRLIQPWYWDGAAFEYSDPEIQHAVCEALTSFQPNAVWFDYTYLWALYPMVRRAHVPIITRSINFEPLHFLEEDGWTLLNLLKAAPKLLSEYLVCKWSKTFLAITPKEAIIYRYIGARNVFLLPLRSLPQFLDFKTVVHDRTPLNVFFSGSTYRVAHNFAALKFLLKEIIPEVRRRFPGKFVFHIFGGKVPLVFQIYFSDDVIKHDYLPHEQFETQMQEMDIAIVPSLYGAGMQQKIFEPLARGLPTIASPRGIAGYAFRDKEHLLLAESAPSFVRLLGELRDIDLRRRLSEASRKRAQELYSEEYMDKVMGLVLDKVVS